MGDGGGRRRKRAPIKNRKIIIKEKEDCKNRRGTAVSKRQQRASLQF
jgi:hypothetical protein